MVGQEIEITGVVTGNLTSVTRRARHRGHRLLGLHGPDERDTKGRRGRLPRPPWIAARDPGKNDGKTVRVFGQFRGRNLFGDLPSRSQASSDDWVIKDDLFAVWVSGKKSKGSGWALDASLKRDTGKWMEVVGRVETRNGVVYIRASEVNRPAARPLTRSRPAAAPAASGRRSRPWSSSAAARARPRSRDSRFVVHSAGHGRGDLLRAVASGTPGRC